MSNSKLTVFFIKDKKMKSYYDYIHFLNKKYYIKNKDLTIDIEDLHFNEKKEKIILELNIIPTDILSKEIIRYKINILYGINKAYCFLNIENNYLIEYNYIDNQRIFYNDYEPNEYDGNGLVKRLILINCPFY